MSSKKLQDSSSFVGKLLPLKNSKLFQRRMSDSGNNSINSTIINPRRSSDTIKSSNDDIIGNLDVTSMGNLELNLPSISNLLKGGNSEFPSRRSSIQYGNVYNNQRQSVYQYNDNDDDDSITMSLNNMFCSRCGDGFDPHEKIVNSNGELWHQQCFVCAQCFRPFPEGVFYEFEGRKYCEHDFHVLFAPCCGKCGKYHVYHVLKDCLKTNGEFVIGRVIKAMNSNWHPRCFRCELCSKELADLGFAKNQGRALCHECNAKEKAIGLGKYICHKCHGVIDDKPLRFRGEVYHPYHFNCTSCAVELNSDAREVKSRPGYCANELNELYCLRCHDKMGIPICGACRRPIEERVVTALGKHWHVEHFVCAKCEKPFLGHRHYEKKGLAYCETHYHQLFGNLCFVCNQVIAGDVFTAMNKAWCVHHFACSICDQKMNQKTKFYECDLKPACKRCYDKFPAEFRRRLRKAFDNTPKKGA